jgi:hypothetical protein
MRETYSAKIETVRISREHIVNFTLSHYIVLELHDSYVLLLNGDMQNDFFKASFRIID